MAKTQLKLPIRLVAIDNGYADHKVAWHDEKGVIQTLKIPALLEVSTGGGLLDTRGNKIDCYEVDGTEFTCNVNVRNPLSLRNANYPLSVANRVLVTHDLVSAGLQAAPVNLAVTLPYRDYFHNDGRMNDELKEGTIKNFSGNTVRISGSNATTDVQKVFVYSEALCGYFDWAIDDKGQIREAAENLEGEVAVVDIGGSTTDIVSLSLTGSGLVINNSASGTERAGVLDARERLEQLVRDRMLSEGIDTSGHDQGVPARVMSKFLETGSARYLGKDWDMTDLRDQACTSVSNRIITFIRSKLGNLGNYEAIVVIGGGAILLRDSLSALLPGAEFLDEFSNARGALKYMSNWENLGN